MAKEKGNETKTCKYCQSEIPKKAKICPNCRKKQGSKLGLIIAIIVIVGIIGIAFSGGSSDSGKASDSDSKASKTAESSASESVVAESSAAEEISYTAVDVTELEDAISNNALKAADTYKDQYLEISGYLNVIDSSGDYITINAGDDDYTLINIQCTIENDDQKDIIMNMNKGDKLTVKGQCTDVGEVLGYTINMDEISAE